MSMSSKTAEKGFSSGGGGGGGGGSHPEQGSRDMTWFSGGANTTTTTTTSTTNNNNTTINKNKLREPPDTTVTTETNRLVRPFTNNNSMRSTTQSQSQSQSGGKPNLGFVPRTSSIDSAISSLSSSHSQKSSFDANTLNSSNINNLINAAGSAEAVIVHLLKEKHHAESQNSRLWRLVDKQRTLVLGLNKDLERALKEKEKYKSKSKELQLKSPSAPLPPAAITTHHSRPAQRNNNDDDDDRSEGQLQDHRAVIPEASYCNYKRHSQSSDPAGATGSTSATRKEEEKENENAYASSFAGSKNPLRIHTASPLSSGSNATESPYQTLSDSPITHDKVNPVFTRTDNLPQGATQQQQAHDANDPDRPVSPKESGAVRPGFAAIFSPSTVNLPDFGVKQTASIPPPIRKPPPAPLVLDESTEHPGAGHTRTYDSDSEYEDILGVDESPNLDRGRGVTRKEEEEEEEEEDDGDDDDNVNDDVDVDDDGDGVHETNLAESHSQSKVEKSNPLGIHWDSDGSHDPPQRKTVPSGLPSSPRQTVPRPPLLAENESSAIATDHRMMTQGAQLNERFVLSPPKSPGLPLSPRPEDRPFGSPMPRMPREISNTLAASETASTSNAAPGLPPSSPWPGPSHFQRTSPFPPGARTPSTCNSINTDDNNTVNGVPATPNSVYAANRPVPSSDTTIKIDPPPLSREANSNSFIYRGLVSEDYPGLLLPPNALPLIEVKVSSSRLRPSRNSYMGIKPSGEEPVFTLSITSRSDNMELWRVEKVTASLPQLDQQVRESSKNFPVKPPDRNIFNGHSPAKVDARRAALNSYFDALLSTSVDEEAALAICQFLTSDAIEPRDDETSLVKSNGQVKPELRRGSDGKPRKEGYLTKRGKNFGGWKARYFVLHDPELKYYDSPGGPHLGTIKVHNAQIGKQSQNTNSRNNSPVGGGDDNPDNHYRHAFLILEPKRKDSSALVRHVLCAESDEERDAWVEALLEYVETHSSEEVSGGKSSSKNSQSPSSSTQGKKSCHSNSSSKSKVSSAGGKGSSSKGTIDGPEVDEQPDVVQGFSYDDAVPAEPPVMGTPHEKISSHPPPPTLLIPPTEPTEFSNQEQNATAAMEHGQAAPLSPRVISGPTNGTVIQDAGAWGNKATATTAKERKRSIWGFRTKSTADLASQIQTTHDTSTTLAPAPISPLPERRGSSAIPVFGLPLADAVHYCAPDGVDVELPAVVYRCIEYLQAKGAESEEGIFRLSGSNIVVKALKERFNTEGDVNFLAGDQYYDVHAVASLFKQYLRELPTTVLTRELHLEFLRVLELEGRQEKLMAFNSLVHKLPSANSALLRALVQFLIEIVNNSDVNKMTVRNVGIVFAPTLNIPSPVFSMFLTEFESIFGEPRAFEESPSSSVNTSPSSLPSESIRSRRQTLSDFPNSAYKTMSSFHQNRGVEDLSPDQANMARFSSMNSLLIPNGDNRQLSKAKRRESSMLFMDTSVGDYSNRLLRDDQSLKEPASG